ncbi:MAG: CubicO group peptidase (beta-lactamase class C family), partial [Pseudohongiellaceae bacterium]
NSLDAAITQLMADYQATAVTVGILKDDRVVYQRGFGWQDYPGGDFTPLSDGALMRVASMTTPFTAAAIVQLINAGVLNDSDKVFAYGQAPGVGILPASTYAPYNGTLGDTRLKDITVEDLLLHRGGFNQNFNGDPQFNAVAIANTLGVSSPPGQVNTVKYMLAQPLAYTPGSSAGLCQGPLCYSNFGFALLGLIIEEVTGMDQVDYIHDNILSQWGGVADELQAGRTFKVDQHPSEPYYHDTNDVVNVYDPSGPLVKSPYGGFDHESFAGHGDLISNNVQLLNLLDWYRVSTNYNLNPTVIPIGSPLPGGFLFGSASHSGGIPGSFVVASQSGDLAIAVITNQEIVFGDFASNVHQAALDWVSSGNPWPSTYATDVWADFTQGSGNGKFTNPENNIPQALGRVQTRGTLKLKPATTNWNGTITQAVVLSAPLGPVTIGQN